MYISRSRMKGMLLGVLTLSCALVANLSTADDLAFEALHHKVVSYHAMPDLDINSNKLELAKEVDDLVPLSTTYLSLLATSESLRAIHIATHYSYYEEVSRRTKTLSS